MASNRSSWPRRHPAEPDLTMPAEHTGRTHDLHCRVLGPDTCLLTCALEQGERVNRCSAIWRRSGDEWVIVFHQGTLVLAP